MFINIEVYRLAMFTNAVKKYKAILLFSHFILDVFKMVQTGITLHLCNY